MSACYLDDVIITGSSHEDHWRRVKEVLEVLRKAELKLKGEKCQISSLK